MLKSTNNRHSATPRISNKKARFRYEILEKIEAGLVLKGTEVKSLRAGQASINEAFVRVGDGQMQLVGAHIAPYELAGHENHEPLRPRRLLLHKREIRRIQAKVEQKGLTVVPLSLYFKRGYAKVEVALARGKTQFDKRQTIQKRQITRDLDRFLKRRR